MSLAAIPQVLVGAHVAQGKEAEGILHDRIALYINDQAQPSKKFCLEEPLPLLETLSISNPHAHPGPPHDDHDVAPWERLHSNENAHVMCDAFKQDVYAMQMHPHVCNNTLHPYEAVSNYVVSMHVDHGNMAIAQQACGKLTHQELPSMENVIGALLTCKQEKKAVYALQVHLHVCSNGMDMHEAINNYVVPMHVHCGNIAIAQQACERLGFQNNNSWTSLLFGFIECGRIDDAFRLYQSMAQSMHVNSSALVALLQTCARLKDVERGRELHVTITLKGFEEDVWVSNTLLGMYAKCHSLSEACVVFDMLPVQDVVSWTALIQGFAEHQLGEEALNCFEKMQREGVFPNAVTFSCVLKACCNTERLGRGREIHNDIVLKGLQSQLSVSNSLIGMYAKYGSLQEAWKVFAVMSARDLVSWTSLIAGYTEHGAVQEALECFEQMQQEGFSPDAVTFACSLKACSNIGAIEKGCEIHKLLLRQGFGRNGLVGNTLIGMYSKWGALAAAREVFNELPIQDCVSWTALISGYAEHGPSEEAVTCYERMQIQGVVPNVITFACVLKACGNIEALAKGQEVHSHVSRTGFERELLISSSLVGMYASCGALGEALEVFDKVSGRDVVLWTALISAYCEHGQGQEALKCFEEMQLAGVSPDAAAFACSLRACSSIEAIDKGREIHLVLAEKGFQKDLSVGNALIGMYTKCGFLSEAQEAFDVLGVRDLLSWTTLIAGYVEHGCGQEALKCFEQMQEEGLCADSITLSCIVNACGSLGAIQKGRETHQLIAEEEFDKDQSVGNSLISMYARCGALADAREVFDTMLVRDSIAWSSMMKGYCLCNEGKLALCCFEDMQKQGVKPDIVTFTCLLTACSHGSLVSKGLHYYKQMREQYNVAPTVEHHTCIVDLLARSGKLYEAEQIVALLCPLQEAAWAALLTACKTYSDRELGLRCFQQLLAMNAEDSTWYVLMTDIYTSTGSPADAQCIESLRKHVGAKKIPASALIEVNKKVYEFVKGSDQNEDISTMLQALNKRIKEEGHLPNVDKILKPIPDKEKEVMLCEHAEKLAIAFGLLTTPQGSTLRVTKSLRMCNECHDSSKIISKIEKRQIILRDICCIHHFKDGLCSCGDLF